MAEKETTEVPVVVAAAAEEEEPVVATTLEELKEPPHVPHPDVKKMKLEEQTIQLELDALDAQISSINKQVAEAQKAAAGQNDGASGARAELARLRKDRESLVKQKQEIFAARDEERESRDKQMSEMAKLKNQTKFRTVDEINRAIKKLETKQETTSMPLAQEKDLIKEIGELKQSRKMLMQHQTAFSQLDGQKLSPADTATQLTSINARLAEIKKQQDSNKAILAKISEKKKDTKMTGLLKKKDELHTEKRSKWDELRKLRDEHKAKFNAWKMNQDELKAYRVKKTKLTKLEDEQRRQADRKAREEALLKKTPYEEEMQLCDYLVNYLTTTFGSAIAAKKQADKPKADKPKAAKPAAAKPAAANVFEGGVEIKKGKEVPYLMLGNKKKSKKGGKGKGNKAIVLVPETIDAFSLLKLDPPTRADQVEACVSALKEKKEWFTTLPRGEIESIAEKNQKFENDQEQRGDRSERRPREHKQKKGGKHAIPDSADLNDFPSLGGPAAAATPAPEATA